MKSHPLLLTARFRIPPADDRWNLEEFEVLVAVLGFYYSMRFEKRKPSGIILNTFHHPYLTVG
jgi:hypothetical protein